MIKSRHMYFVIATMALGYVGDAAAVTVTAPRLSDRPAPNGKLARKYNVDDSVGCVACLQYDERTYVGVSGFDEYLAEELSDYGNADLACNTNLDSIEVYSWGTSSRPNDNGVYYNCTASGWTLKQPTLPNGTYSSNHGTIKNGRNCIYITDGAYYSCESCTSASCDDGYYGAPTGCAIKANDCHKCPVSTNRTSYGNSASTYVCTDQLQAGQSTAGYNRTISGCKIPRFYGGSDGAYCNDNGFFIWDSECSYAG